MLKTITCKECFNSRGYIAKCKICNGSSVVKCLIYNLWSSADAKHECENYR